MVPFEYLQTALISKRFFKSKSFYMWRVQFRPAQFFLENWDKLHSEVLAKMWVDAKFYRIPATFDHASEALKVPKAVRISPILVRLELQRRGETLPVCDKIWCPLTFWPKLHCGVCPISPKLLIWELWTNIEDVFTIFLLIFSCASLPCLLKRR